MQQGGGRLYYFFDLIGLATQASWVLYCIKYPNESIVKLKNRKIFLYRLGTQLAENLVISRMNSSSFRYLSTDIKQQILSITNSVDRPNPIPHDIETIPIPHDIETNPIPHADEAYSIQLGPPNNCNLEPIVSEIIVNNISTNISSEDVLNEDQIQESSTQHSAKLNTPRSKVGRCHFCQRDKDKKTRKKCDSCLAFICPLHTKNIILCDNCNEKMSLV